MSYKISDSALSSPLATLSVQNAEVAKLIQTGYSPADLEVVRKALVAHNTLTLRRYPSGGHSAVTILDINETLYSSLDGLLYNMWDRDNIMQCLAELTLAEDDALRVGLPVDVKAWRRGMVAALEHHKKGDYRFVDLCLGRASGYPKDYMRRPHIRYNPISLSECGDNWGHGQNDSLSFLNFMLFHGLRTNRINWTDIDLQPSALSFAALCHGLFWKIHVWEDYDLGAWEDCVGRHWSSVACALVSLREQRKFLQASGKPLHYNKDGHDFWVTENGVRELIEKCEATLREMGTNEFIASESGATRSVDLAQLNPLLLAAFAGEPVLDDANTVAVLEKIEAELLGHIGLRRYTNDLWDGRINRHDFGEKEEAQWVHGSPQMSFIYGDLYERTGDERFYDKQVLHFNRALASISPRWLTPEAWIIDAHTRNWVADANEPLAWAQSMLVLALAGMKQSIALKSQTATAAAAA